MNGNGFGTVSLGLTAAGTWGAADFFGGVASRNANPFIVVIGAEATGLLVLVPLAFFTGDPLPHTNMLLVGALAGLCGGFGLALLYQALAQGKMSLAAPISAVVGAIIPVLVGVINKGIPENTTIAGIFLGLVAIMLVAYQRSASHLRSFDLSQLTLPLLAGLFFGLFFVLLNAASQHSSYWPIIATRVSSILFLCLITFFTRKALLPTRKALPLVALCGLMDTSGNTFFVLAGQVGRLDIAAVLSSLYPAVTVIMAWLFLKERVAPTQIIGIIAAVIAILLIVI